jgi:hypothetical protein
MRTFIYLLLISALCIQGMQVKAQKEDDPHERIKAMKIAFITERLELSTGEAEKFWPVYNDYENRKHKIMKEIRDLRKYYTENQESIGEKEQLELLDKFIKLQKEDAELLPSYHEKFIEVLPPQKVMKLYISEIQFRNYLLQKLRDHHEPGRQKRPE